MSARRWTVATIALALLASGVSAISANAAPAKATGKATGRASASSALTATEKAVAKLPKPKAIKWGACSDAGLQQAGAQCGFLTVPLDWSKPKGATIKIAVSRVLHTVPAAKYQGIMVTNPGGPGGSGLTLSTLGSAVPNGAGDSYDWIGFDPRGVGSSIPHLSCIPDYFAGPRPQYEPTTKKLENEWLSRTKAYDKACASQKQLLNHDTTRDTAYDMDYLRAALGQKQMNYYGFSYGTYLGQVYSTLFPHHMRRMVLDSTVDPRGVWYKANLKQDVAFEKTVNIWFGWVAKYDSVYHLGKTAADVSALWYKEKKKLAKNPAGGVVGADEWTDIFLYAGYYQITWLEFGDLFSQWVHNQNVDLLVSEYENWVGPTDDNGFVGYAAVQCTDVQWPTSWSKWRTDNWRTYAKAPFETWGNAWFNAPCLYWPAKAQTPVTINGAKTKSALMIDETLDAATPYPGSLYVRSLYPGARLIAEPGGTTHAGTLYGDACVDDQIAAYIANGTLPARKAGNGPDATCAPLPQPVPTAPSPTVNSVAKSSGSSVAATRERLKAAVGPIG